jgi:aminoglycoside phosphotransferase (APT) family kinase protein
VTAELLARACARHLPDVTGVTAATRLSGGASRETWSFDATRVDGTVDRLVLRRDPGSTIGSTDRSTEYELVRAAGSAGVAVPAVRFLLDAEDELGAGFVMERIDGETIPRKLLRDEPYADARRVLVAQCAGAAARIHAVPLDTLPRLPVQDAPALIDQFRGVIDALGEPHPAFELGLRWLAERAPGLPRTAPALVHGDFRTGNFVVGSEGLRAVLDWELAHLGDPIEDLGWFCVKSWRFGNVAQRAGGFGSADELLAAYADAGGAAVDPDHLRFWEVFGTLKWGVICEMQTFSHLNGMVRSVELAALGRRVAEQEWDLLALIDPEEQQREGSATRSGATGMAAPGTPGPSGRADEQSHEWEAGVHDRPTLSELVESVREYLERDVMAVEGRVGFHARVASRVLAMVERELAVGPSQARADHERLASLLGTDGSIRDLTVELARRIRAGEIPGDDRETLDAIRASVRAKLAVTAPDYPND